MSSLIRWTAAEDDQLRALWLSGRPSPDIAGTMGKTKGQIIGRAHRLKLPPHALSAIVVGWSDAQDIALRDGWARKLSGRVIGEIVGRSKAAVEARAKMLGLGHRGRSSMIGQRSAPSPFRPMLSTVKARDNSEAATIRRTRDPAPAFKGGATNCQWIEGEVRRHPHTDDNKCGAPRVEGRPYCQSHLARAFHRVQPPSVLGLSSPEEASPSSPGA